MASIQQHMAARNDTDLTARLVAAAEIAGVPNPQGWAEANRGRLVSVQLDENTTLADVHAYAVASYTPTPRPGADDTKLRDALLTDAVAKVRAAEGA